MPKPHADISVSVVNYFDAKKSGLLYLNSLQVKASMYTWQFHDNVHIALGAGTVLRKEHTS